MRSANETVYTTWVHEGHDDAPFELLTLKALASATVQLRHIVVRCSIVANPGALCACCNQQSYWPNSLSVSIN